MVSDGKLGIEGTVRHARNASGLSWMMLTDHADKIRKWSKYAALCAEKQQLPGVEGVLVTPGAEFVARRLFGEGHALGYAMSALSRCRTQPARPKRSSPRSGSRTCLRPSRPSPTRTCGVTTGTTGELRASRPLSWLPAAARASRAKHALAGSGCSEGTFGGGRAGASLSDSWSASRAPTRTPSRSRSCRGSGTSHG